jgi:hypothetical protein
VVADGRVWVGQAPGASYAAPHGILVQLDRAGLRPLGRVRGVTIGQLGAGGGAVWSMGAAGGLEMDRIDPASGRVVRQTLGGAGGGAANRPTNIVSGFGFACTGSPRAAATSRSGCRPRRRPSPRRRTGSGSPPATGGSFA